MNQSDFLDRLVQRLDEASIPYMISGSLASSFYGEPRATNDIDVVISPTEEELTKFIRSLGDDYYTDERAAIQSLRNRSLFNIIDNLTGWKADLIIRKDRPFSVEEFQRRTAASLWGVNVFIVSIEDSILSKLEWSKKSDSDLQFCDALSIATIQWEKLDKDYLMKWGRELGIEDYVGRLLKRAQQDCD